MKIQRMFVIKLHAVLACFFIPTATLYFVSGGLYTLGIEGHTEKTVYQLELDRPFTPDLDRLSGLANSALAERELVLPTGDAKITSKKGAYKYRWGDLKRLVEIEPTDDPLRVELAYRQRNALAQVMRMHKAEAGSIVKVLSVSMAVSLLLILSSGVYLALGLPKLRKTALIALGAGCVVMLPIFL
jgi:hypothetical protein